MDTKLRERLRELTIQRAKMEAENPSLMLVSNPTHTMICSEINSINRQLAGEYAQMILKTKETTNGDSHHSTR